MPELCLHGPSNGVVRRGVSPPHPSCPPVVLLVVAVHRGVCRLARLSKDLGARGSLHMSAVRAASGVVGLACGVCTGVGHLRCPPKQRLQRTGEARGSAPMIGP